VRECAYGRPPAGANPFVPSARSRRTTSARSGRNRDTEGRSDRRSTGDPPGGTCRTDRCPVHGPSPPAGFAPPRHGSRTPQRDCAGDRHCNRSRLPHQIAWSCTGRHGRGVGNPRDSSSDRCRPRPAPRLAPAGCGASPFDRRRASERVCPLRAEYRPPNTVDRRTTGRSARALPGQLG